MENIAQKIKFLSDLIEKKSNNELASRNITLGQARILIFLLKSTKQLSLKDLEKLFNVSQATMQGTICRMEKKGYLCTVYMSGDKKTKYAVLTDYGRELAEDLFKFIEDANRSIMEPLTAAEQTEFSRLLSKISSYVKQQTL